MEKMYHSYNRHAKPPLRPTETPTDGSPVFYTAQNILDMKFPDMTFVKTGINVIDRKMRGLGKGQVSVWSGLRASGKSSVVSEIGLNAVEDGNNVAYFSGELFCKDFMDWMKEQADWEKTVAIGEIGLDYYWDKEPEVQEKQRYWFGRQIELARETGLPIIVHSRDAAADTMQVMKEHHAEEIPGVIHCYSYSKEMALEFIKMGYYIGVGGVVTFKNAKKLIETVEAIPLESILLETDCPYMAPEPYRGKRNSSLYLTYVRDKIAEIKGISPEEVERVTEQNARKLFYKVK
jgi:TatD DNase family protein